MSKWVVVGGGILALLWAPFVYKELTRESLSTAEDGIASADDDELEEDEPIAVAALPTAEPPAEAPAPVEPPPSPEPEELPPAPEAAPVADAPPAPPPPAGRADDEEDDVAAQEPEQGAAAEEGDETPSEPPRPPPQIPESGPYTAVKGVFESETRDSLWASERERTLAAELVAEGFSEQAVGEVACRRTLCRFEVMMTAEDLPPLMRLAAGLRSASGNQGLAVSASEQVEDKSRVMVYMPRRGYSLDEVAQGR